MRAVSTVIDVSVCLLLVSASVLTLVGTPTGCPVDPDVADERAETLTTSTARVSYAVGDGRRSLHDTLAGLLAGAAVASAGVVRPNEGSAAFQRAVTDRVNRTLRRFESGVQVTVTWRPVADSTLGGRVVAGDRPPPDADLHAATVVVSSGVPGVRRAAMAAAERDGFEGVARTIATRVRAVPGGNLTVVGPLERDLRERYRTPAGAARAATVDRARLTVRTWST